MAAPAAGGTAVAAQGAGGGRRDEPARPSMVGILLQVGAMLLLWNTFANRGTPQQGKVADKDAAAPGVVAHATPTPSVAPEAPSMMELLSGASTQAAKVPEALRWFEDERKAAMRTVAPDARLVPLWRYGQVFDVYVYASYTGARVRTHTPSQAHGVAAHRSEQRNAAASVRADGAVDDEFDSGASRPAPPVHVHTHTHASTPRVRRQVDSGASAQGLTILGHRINVYGNNLMEVFPLVPSETLPNATVSVLEDLDTGAAEHVLLWHVGGLTYTDAVENYVEQQLDVRLPAGVRNNGTLYAHVFLVSGAAPIDKDDPAYDSRLVVSAVYPLIVFKKKMNVVLHNLLTGEGAEGAAPPKQAEFGIGLAAAEDTGEQKKAAEQAAAAKAPIVAYWRPQLHIQAVQDFTPYKRNGLPPQMASALWVDPLTPGYLPVTFVNDFWMLRSHWIQVNSSVEHVPLTISFSPQAMWKWAMMSQMQASWDAQESWGTSQEGESDMIKNVLLEANPILLGITMIVSTLHMVFDFLAFKNDISFWRNAKSFEGLSLRSILVNVFFQVVIVLYLFTNETSWIVLGSSCVGLLIEIWKLRKAVAINVTWHGWMPVINLDDKEDSNYASSRTKEYDDIATNHMLYMLTPLVIGYALYSLFYERHRGWFSWLVSSLVGFVYTFGFIQMVPQLYINYRLKSVAHMPWRAMVYKSLNTFIDDLFAWVIKMPTLHRVAVFRDDIIFLIYLYQRWIYPVDKTRKNEFGASAEDYEAVEARKRGEQRVARRAKRVTHEEWMRTTSAPAS